MGQKPSARQASTVKIFEHFQQWTVERLRKVLQSHHAREFDFCPDASSVAALIGLDDAKTQEVVTIFTGRIDGFLNLLSFLSGIAVISSKIPSFTERASFVFDCFDLRGRGQMTFDDLTITLLSMSRAVVLMAGRGELPTDGGMEQQSFSMYYFLAKPMDDIVTKAEFLLAARHLLSHRSATTDTATIEDLLIVLALLEAPNPDSYPVFTPQHTSLLARHLSPALYVEHHTRYTRTKGIKLDDLIQTGVDNPATDVGIVMGDAECYVTFAQLIDPLLEAINDCPMENLLQKVNADMEAITWSSMPILDSGVVKRVQVSAARNLYGLAFPSMQTRNERRYAEHMLSQALQSLKFELHGTYRAVTSARGRAESATSPPETPAAAGANKHGALQSVKSSRALKGCQLGSGRQLTSAEEVATGKTLRVDRQRKDIGSFTQEAGSSRAIGSRSPRSFKRASPGSRRGLGSTRDKTEVEGDAELDVDLAPPPLGVSPGNAWLMEDPFFYQPITELEVQMPHAGTEWPDSRGVFESADGRMMGIVNGEDHLQVTSGEHGCNVRGAFERLYKSLHAIQDHLEATCGASFTFDKRYGYLTSRLTRVGPALCITCHMHLPEMTQRMNDLKALAWRVGLKVTDAREGVATLVNRRSLGCSEVEVLVTMMTGIATLSQLEKAMVMGDRARAEQITSTLPVHWRPPTVPPVSAPRVVKAPAQYVPDVMPDFPALSEHHTSLVAEYLTPEIYDSSGGRHTKLGATINDVIKPALESSGLRVGITACDEESYTTFSELLTPIISALQSHIPAHAPPTDTSVPSDPTLQAGDAIRGLSASLARNIHGYALPPLISRGDRHKLERLLRETLECALEGWSYYTLAELQGPVAHMYRERGLLFGEPMRGGFLWASGGVRDWPDGRGVMVSESKAAAAWVNEEDHLRLVCVGDDGDGPADIAAMVQLLLHTASAVEKALAEQGAHYMRSGSLGHLTTSPSNLGTALRLRAKLRLPGFRLTAANRARLGELGLQGARDKGQSGVLVVSNARTLALAEAELVSEFVRGIRSLVEEWGPHEGEAADEHDTHRTVSTPRSGRRCAKGPRGVESV